MKTDTLRLPLTLFALLLGASLYAACNRTNNANTPTTNTVNTTTTAANTSNTNGRAAGAEAPAGKMTSGHAAGDEHAAHTPAEGSAEREVILEGIRDYLKNEKDFPNAVIEEVEYLKVSGEWAYINCFAGAPDGHPYGSIEGLLKKQPGGSWKVLEILDYDNSTERSQRAAFRARHKGAPDNIFPPTP